MDTAYYQTQENTSKVEESSQECSQNRPLNLRGLVNLMSLFCPHEVEEMFRSREYLEKYISLCKGLEDQSAIAKNELKKKYNLTMDIEQPPADSPAEREPLRVLENK